MNTPKIIPGFMRPWGRRMIKSEYQQNLELYVFNDLTR